MDRAAETTAAAEARTAKPAASELGRKLRRISEKIAAAGEKRLTRRQLEREIAERRGGIA